MTWIEPASSHSQFVKNQQVFTAPGNCIRMQVPFGARGKMHKVLMQLQCKAISFRRLEHILPFDDFHSGVHVQFENRHHKSFSYPNQVGFVLKVNQSYTDLVCHGTMHGKESFGTSASRPKWYHTRLDMMGAQQSVGV